MKSVISVVIIMLFSAVVLVSCGNNHTLTQTLATRTVLSFMHHNTQGFDIVGITKLGNNTDRVDFIVKGWLLRKPKRIGFMASYYGPGGGTYRWSGKGYAVFTQYQSGKWILRLIKTPDGEWDNINRVAK